MQKWMFLALAVKNFRTVGAVWPSSKFLVEKMVRPIDFSKARCIVELGAGNGCMTRALLQRMRKDATLVVFEMKKEFCTHLRKIQDKRLIVVQDSAERMQDYLQERKMARADYVVSSLPLGTLSKEAVATISGAIFVTLKPHGQYIQFQYFLKSYRLVKQLYDKVRLDFTLWNLPPAFVYVCQKS